jgi:hypothetical protein
MLVVPWSAAPDEVPSHFIDLRDDPYALDQISEAEQHPSLQQALRALNAGRSPVFTAKCDVWAMSEDEVAGLAHNLDLAGPEHTAGFASYLDLVWRERSLFLSFHQHEQRLDRLARLLEAVDLPLAGVESVIRPALVDLTGPQEGFCVTLYVKALGTNSAGAYATWATALDAVVAILRSKEFTFA